MALVVQGYLESPWLTPAGWLGGTAQDFGGVQVSMQAAGSEVIPAQVEMRIVDDEDDEFLNVQVNMRKFTTDNLNTQVEQIVAAIDGLGIEVNQKSGLLTGLLTQVEGLIVDAEADLNMEVKLAQSVSQRICAGWLQEAWLQDVSWLATRICAHVFTQVTMSPIETDPINTQVEMRIVDEDDDPQVKTQVEMQVFNEDSTPTQVKAKVLVEDPLPTQVEMQVFDQRDLYTQVEMKVFVDDSNNVQVNRISAEILNTQVTMVIYNTTQLRLLCDFASRGTPALGGNNWTSVQALGTGDLGMISNLNTDIIEQRVQTASATALWQLRCDTGNVNTFMDTLAILNHNFTRSVRVEISGSDDPAFGSIKFTYVMVAELVDMYFIAPTLPNIPAQYYQLSIQDPGNPDGYLSIGTVLFGSAAIMTRSEQFINPVTFGQRHFKDSLQTEGFTSVSNDRALRKYLNLTFSMLKIDGGNFRQLTDYMDTAKTDLKCLVIPRPSRPSRLAVFAKMSQLPEQLHQAIDDDNWRVDLTFDWDESL